MQAKVRSLLKKARQPLLFLMCGSLSAFIELVTFLLLKNHFSNVYWPSLISFCIGLIASFLLNKFVVFKSGSGRKKFAREAGTFLLLGLINSQLSAWITIGMFEVLDNKNYAKVFSMVIIALWNYLIMNRLIFRKKKVSD